MKIVHIMISCFYIEGAGYQENLMPRAHHRLGNEVTIISSQYCFDGKYQKQQRPAGTYINNDGIKVVILPDTKKLPSFLKRYQRKCQHLYSTIEKEKPDVIFMHGINAKDGLDVANYVAKFPKVKLFCDHHSDYYNSKINVGWRNKIRFYLMVRPIARFVASKAQMVWGTTPWRVEYLQELYGLSADKTGFLVMGADETKIEWNNREEIRNEVREEYRIQKEDFLIVTGGKLNLTKNTHLLAQAVSEIDLPNVKLLIFGQPDDGIKPELDKYENNPRIKQIGWIASDKAYDIFLAADLGYFPGTHSVLWEQAVACGLPTVFKLWDGMKHVNVNGNAILQENPNVQSIKQLLEVLIQDKSRYNTMKENAIAAKDGFCYREIAKRAIGIS